MDSDCDSSPSNTERLATVHLDIDASPERVWHAITTDEGLAGWMGDGATLADAPRGDLAMPDVTTGRPRRGRVQHIDTARHLTYEWWPEDAPEVVTSVSINLEEVDAGTRVTVIEQTARLTTSAQASAPIGEPGFSSTADWAWRVALLVVVGLSNRTPVHAVMR